MISSKNIFNKSKYFTPIDLGFTLIELLVVIGVLGILLAITLIAINPTRQLSQANNTKRASDVNTILAAVNEYITDNMGNVPPGIPMDTAQEISNTGANICDDLVPKYIPSFPRDPSLGKTPIEPPCPSIYSTLYKIFKSTVDGRITVSALGTEIPPASVEISATR